MAVLVIYYSKRHNKFLLPVPAKAIYGSFCRTENEIFNVVNYRLLYHYLAHGKQEIRKIFSITKRDSILFDTVPLILLP